MGLQRYWHKRDFGKTSEPRGRPGRKKAAGLQFVIQKHAATRLHYDFRLELDGVLLSWAVPKGPSLDPADKRLAVHVEDHPIEYGDFEGVIAKGQYGGGTVLLWDRGTWQPIGDPREGLRQGHLKFELDGEKLHGVWALVRFGRAGQDERDNWLLVKDRDAEATDQLDITAARPESVATGRQMAEIEAAKDRVWDTRGGEVSFEGGTVTARPKASAARTRPRAAKAKKPEKPAPALGKPGPLPASVAPQLATPTTAPPAGDDWLHEIKFDGYRALCRIEAGEVQVRTRGGHDWSGKFPALRRELGRLPCDTALLDVEMVVLQADGTSDFQLLAQRLGAGGDAGVTCYAFDLLYLDGRDLRGEPLVRRKEALAALLQGHHGRVRYTEHLQGDGAAFYQAACAARLEGIVSKRADRKYVSGRTRAWLKIKCLNRQEFVIVGYTEPKGARSGFGALLLGVHRDGDLHYVGRVGTGFGEAALRDLQRQLEALATEQAPVKVPPEGAEGRGVHWVRPELVAEVEFAEWTQDDRLRQPSFKGLRADKRPADVVDERQQVEAPPAEPKPRAKAQTGPRPALVPPGARPELEAKGGALRIAGVAISHPNKVLYPEAGVTKLHLAEYVASVADRMLPHLAGRLLTLFRCPDGAHRPCFFQKHRGSGLPEAVRSLDVLEKEGDVEHYLYVEDVAGLVSLVQMGALEVHPWGSLAQSLDKPDRLIFDLDPDPALSWLRLVEAAQLIRALLAHFDLQSFVKTTGGKGLHVVLPIERRHGWDEAKEFCRLVAEAVVRADPDRFTAKAALAKRGGRIFVDWLRNARGATAIAPWGTRARPGAPVAVPLAWQEVEAVGRGDRFHVDDVAPRLEAPDPWQGFFEVRQRLSKAALRELRG